jgi:hemerythrin
MITWDESMSTGVALIDAQHKMIFQKFNEFSEAIAEGASREAAAEILDFLQFYASWHFKREEKCMDEYKCPVAAQNQQAHAEFLATFNGYYEQWQNGTMTPALARKTHRELENWLLNHIGHTDVQLRLCVGKGAGS